MAENPKFRVAVVTPYYQEQAGILRQCHESVLAQTYPCDHFVVADGHPHSIFGDGSAARHVILPFANGDNGNTPRAIGGILAAAYGYDAVGYLDADNWLDPRHVELLVGAHERAGTPLVSSRRLFVDLEGLPLPISENQEDTGNHVDTSCWLIFRPAFSLLRAWLMPKQLAPLCDRIFFAKVRHEHFGAARIMDRTVMFRSQYVSHYVESGREPPPGAKDIMPIWQEVRRFTLDAGRVQEIVSALGFYPQV